MDKTLNIPKVKSLPSFGFYSNDTDLEEENQGTRSQVRDSWSIGDPSDCISEMTEFAVLGRHLMKDQKSHNLCIVADIQQLLMNFLLKKQYEVLKIIIHSMW